MLGLALAILGYDPNTANPDEITEAKDYLIEHGQNVVVIAADDGQAYLERGDVDIAIEYSGDIFQLAATCECEDYVYVLPEPTAQVWVDNLAIPLGAPNKALAEAFIDYILDPKVGADISNYTAYASPNQASIESGLLLPEYQNNPIIYPDEETLGRLFTTLDVPEAELDYNDAWDEIKISLGR
jgi:spermidine/putrescine transport system substrate-binding protein